MNEANSEVQAFIKGGIFGIPDLAESFLDQDIAKKKEPAVHHPVPVIVAAQKRFRFIWQQIRKLKILGDIQCHFFRAEYQNRGAIHWHCIVWVKPGTMPCNLISAGLPRGSDELSLKLRE